MAKQTIKQRKAIRSAAAKKGWETRIARERREIEAAEDRAYVLAQEALDRVSNAHVSPPREMIPNDLETVALRSERWRGAIERELADARPPSLWQRIKRWFA